MEHGDDVRDWVSDYYGRVLKESADLKTNACCATGAPPAWIASALSNVSNTIQQKFYGCGFPIPQATRGSKILDLGCGAGRDVYILSQLVGEQGFVHGVDMTEEQLRVARDELPRHMEHFGYERPNVAFHTGYIEDLSALPIEDASLDVVISNCVVNLSPRKDLILAEVARVLKPGGEFYFSDVFVDRRLPEAIAFDPELHAECLGGAMYRPDFEQLARAAGFLDPRMLERGAITIQNASIEQKVGNARFESVTLRLFKLDGLDPQCEDYGQVAIYKGSIPEAPSLYVLDDHHAFETNRPERVCANTAAMLQKTRLGEHFTILGDTSTHYGAFDCSSTMATPRTHNAPSMSDVSCC